MAFLSMLDGVDNGSSIASIRGAKDQGWDELPATADELEGFFDHLERTVKSTGFLDPENPRQLMSRLRRFFESGHRQS